MHVDHGLLDMLRPQKKTGAGSRTSAQPLDANQDVEMSVLDNKGSKESAAVSGAGPEGSTASTSKDGPSDNRATEAPDTVSRPDGKA